MALLILFNAYELRQPERSVLLSRIAIRVFRVPSKAILSLMSLVAVKGHWTTREKRYLILHDHLVAEAWE